MESRVIYKQPVGASDWGDLVKYLILGEWRAPSEKVLNTKYSLSKVKTHLPSALTGGNLHEPGGVGASIKLC